MFNLLLGSDAIHAAACKMYEISDIATNDGDFKRVDFLNVWEPSLLGIILVVFGTLAYTLQLLYVYYDKRPCPQHIAWFVFIMTTLLIFFFNV